MRRAAVSNIFSDYKEVSKMKMLSLFKNSHAHYCAGIATLFLSLASGGVYAHPETAEHHDDPEHPHDHSDSDGGSNLGDQATNPVAPLMSFRFQYQNSPSNYNADGYSQAAIGQVVLPIPLPFESVPMTINRFTIPYISTPDLGEPVNRKHGFADTAVLSFLIPDLGLKGHTLAIGASIGIPTGGDNEFTGSGQWTLGPTIGYINTQVKGLQWGGAGVSELGRR
jgi:hypothetical protein